MRLEVNRDWTMHDNKDFNLYPGALDSKSHLWTLLALYVDSSCVLFLVLCSKLAGLVFPHLNKLPADRAL